MVVIEGRAAIEPGEARLRIGGELGVGGQPGLEALHAAQVSGAGVIAVAPIPEEGVGIAINDRLRRAAANR